MTRTRCKGSIFVLVVLSVVAASTAEAGLTEWQTEVATGVPAVFTDSNVVSPTTRNIGALTGDKTYEFVVNATLDGTSSCLISRSDVAPYHAIKFEQSADSQRYGVTHWAVLDYQFPDVTVTAGAPVHLAFVARGTEGKTTLYVNGIARSAVPIVVDLQGDVGVGQANLGGGDVLTGTFLAIATYDSALTQAELRNHASAWFDWSPPVPDPRPLMVAVSFYLARFYAGPVSDPATHDIFEKACLGLDACLVDEYWEADDRLSADGSKTFATVSKVVKSLLGKVVPRGSGESEMDARFAIMDLAAAFNVFVGNAIDDAVADAGGDPKLQKSIDKAQAAYAAAYAAVVVDDYVAALKSYKKAWAAAMKILR